MSEAIFDLLMEECWFQWPVPLRAPVLKWCNFSTQKWCKWRDDRRVHTQTVTSFAFSLPCRVSNGSAAVTWLRHLSLARGLLENLYQQQSTAARNERIWPTFDSLNCREYTYWQDTSVALVWESFHVCEASYKSVHLRIWCRVGGSVSPHMAAGAVGPAKREAQLLGEGSMAFLCLCPLSLQTHTRTHTHTRAYIQYIPTHTHTLSITHTAAAPW